MHNRPPLEPRGRQKIAHRFIGGIKRRWSMSPARDGRNVFSKSLSPLRGFGVFFRSLPTAEALGYSLSPSGLNGVTSLLTMEMRTCHITEWNGSGATHFPSQLLGSQLAGLPSPEVYTQLACHRHYGNFPCRLFPSRPFWRKAFQGFSPV